MQGVYEEIRGLGGAIFLIGPETEENALKLMDKAHASIPLLYDLDDAVIEAYRLAFELPKSMQEGAIARGLDAAGWNPGTGWRLPIPATYVINGAGQVHARYVNADHTYRMEPSDVLAAVREAQRA